MRLEHLLSGRIQKEGSCRSSTVATRRSSETKWNTSFLERTLLSCRLNIDDRKPLLSGWFLLLLVTAFPVYPLSRIKEAGHSVDTATVRCEEGGDDVKSARPLRPGLHTCYNGAYRELSAGNVSLILKVPLSSDWGLQPDPTKLDSLVIAHQPWRGEYVPGPCTHRPSSHESRGRLKSVTARVGLG